MHSKSSASRRGRCAILAIVGMAILGGIAWTSAPSTVLGSYRAGNAWQGTVPVPQSITLLEDSVVGGGKIHGVVRIFSRVTGDNTVKLQTDKPNVLKAPGGGAWPVLVSFPSGTEAAFEFETNTVTEATEVRLFACKSNLANADCTDETSNALVTFTVLPSGSPPVDSQPDRSNITPYHVQPLPINLSTSLKAVLGGVVDFDLTTHSLLRVKGSRTSTTTTVTSSTPLPDTVSGSTTTTPTTTGGTATNGTSTSNVYEIDTDNRALLVSPKEGGVWPVTQPFNGGFNALLRVKTKSPAQVGQTGPVYVKLFARKPGATKTAIVSVQVQ